MTKQKRRPSDLKYLTDPAVVEARGRFGAALRECDEDLAAQAARELVRARRAYRMKKDVEAMAAVGQKERASA